MSTTQHQQLFTLLTQLEQEMVAAGQWASESPAASAFQSTQPFCIDTMSFAQWLQFIFVQRLATLIQQQQPLPHLPVGQGVSPMAEEFFKNQPEYKRLLGIIKQIDLLLSE